MSIVQAVRSLWTHLILPVSGSFFSSGAADASGLLVVKPEVWVSVTSVG